MRSLFRPQLFRNASQAAESRARRPRRPQLGLETLEGRQLLSLGIELGGPQDSLGPQELPVTASAPDGRSVLVWVDRGPTTSSPEKIEFRLRNANDNASTGDIVVQAGNDPTDPAVAMDQNGNFVITWTQQDNVLAQRFNASGKAVGGVITVAGTSLIEGHPDVAIDRNGNFVIVYEQANDVVGKQFSSSGNLLRTLDTRSVSSFVELRPSVAMAADGRFAIAYELFANGNNANSNIASISYFADGRIRSNQLVADSLAEEEDPDVAIRDDGEYTVAYVKGPLANTDIVAQRVSFDGRKFGEIVIANSSRREVDPQIVMNRNGFGFVVAFDSFGSDGARVGVTEVSGNNKVTKLNDITGNAINPALSIDANGGYQLVYQRTVNGDNNVFRRRGNLAN